MYYSSTILDYKVKERNIKMETYLVYYDETGDDGCNTKSSDTFILTSVYMHSTDWKENYYKIKELRRTLKNDFGFHVSQEMHTKYFLTDKDPYRQYNWTEEQKKQILIEFIRTISNLNIQVVNVIIDKTKIRTTNYNVLENALKYNIQRIENTSANKWNYIIITDEGRISPMRKTARAMRVYNPIQSKFNSSSTNKPIQNMIEDILDKNSKESSFIQVCDFISYFTHLYFNLKTGRKIPNRVAKLIDESFINSTFATFKSGNILNTKASSANNLGLVIYPK